MRAQLKNLYGTDPQNIRDGVLQEALHRWPGEAVEYTDRAALILDCLAEHLSRQRLHQLATERTWQPLGMQTARFGPLCSEIAAQCAPTELDQDTDTHLKGIAHDFSARGLLLRPPQPLAARHQREHQRAASPVLPQGHRPVPAQPHRS